MEQTSQKVIVSLRDIFVRFDGEVIINHINLDISEKEFVSYFGDKPERLLEIMRQLSTRVRNQTKDYEAARRILDSMLTTRPEKRSPTLKKEVKRLLDSYNDTMNLVNKYAGSSMFYPFSPDQF